MNLRRSYFIGSIGLQACFASMSLASGRKSVWPTSSIAFVTNQPHRCPVREVHAIRHMSSNDEYLINEEDILTPETYADSKMAIHEVRHTILHAASEAFDSTDFTHEPHLSPELEVAEVAFEAALLANAAHELVGASEKENRQSKAAVLEREKELELIEDHDDVNGGSFGIDQSLLKP